MEGKVALVTGSTSGIGRNIAELLATRGCSVVITGQVTKEEGEAQAQEFSQKYKGKFHFLEADFAQAEQVEKLGQDVLGLYPDGIHILVNCAGIPGRARIESVTTDLWQLALSINLTAPFLLTRAFLPAMKQRGWGRIINMSSVMGITAGEGKAAYCTTKAGLLGLTRVTALEGAPHGVTCNAICPSYTDAPMGHSMIEREAQERGITYEERRAQFVNDYLPVGHLIPKEELSELVGFLCTSSTSCLTGHPIVIDGCYLLR